MVMLNHSQRLNLISLMRDSSRKCQLERNNDGYISSTGKMGLWIIEDTRVVPNTVGNVKQQQQSEKKNRCATLIPLVKEAIIPTSPTMPAFRYIPKSNGKDGE